MLAYPQTDEVARQFLTPTAAENWDSGAGLVVYENNDQTMTENASGILVRSRILGSLDSRGSWSTADPDNAEVTVAMRLTQIDGEWRIVNPLPGTYVDRDYFARSYAHLSMYYFDPTKQVLAPDLVYLMIGDETPTELVANLLHGPTRELTGVVQTMAPQNLELDGRVRITGTIDRVEASADGTTVIVDLKTGRTPPTAAQTAAHPQLAAYQLAARAGAVPNRGILGGAKLVYLAKPASGDAYTERAQQPFDDEAEALFRERLDAVAQTMAGRVFDGPAELGFGSRFGAWQYRVHLVPAVSA